MDLEKLGAALRERREVLGIPRAEVARRVGVSPTYIWLVEGARRRAGGEPSRPTQAVLERWARALGMDDRYTRQALLLAGYGVPEEARPQSPAMNVTAPTTQLMRAARATMASMPASAAQAHLERSADAGDTPAAFAQAPLHFQQPRELQSEVLLDQVRQVLGLAQSEENRWKEVTALLESFLDWLRFRLEREE